MKTVVWPKVGDLDPSEPTWVCVQVKQSYSATEGTYEFAAMFKPIRAVQEWYDRTVLAKTVTP